MRLRGTNMSPKLLTNGTIISFDAADSSITVLRNSHILVTGDTVTEITDNLSTIHTPPDTEIIDCSGKIISPGFVDTHRHLWQTAWRTQAPNVTLTEYFLRYGPQATTKNAYSADDIYISSLAGYCDALNTGVTTLLDHAHNHWRKDVMHAGLRAAADSGTRVWWCFDPTGTSAEAWGFNEQVAELKALAQRPEGGTSGQGPLVRFGLACDSIAHADPGRVDRIKTLISDLNLEALTVHYLGGPWPIGNNSPSSADSRGLLDLSIPVIFSHGGFIPAADRDLLRSKNHFLSITPESEMHYGHGQVDSLSVQDHASLGVDTAFTFSGDLLTQARLWLQSVRLQRYNDTLARGKIPRETPMTPEQAFLLATRQGGKALRRDDIGVLRVGGKADLVIFDGNGPHMCGWNDPVAALVLHANVGDIEGVMVGGEWRKKDGKLVGTFGGMEWEEVKIKFLETATRVQESNKEVEMPSTLFGAELGHVETVAL
jgi:cytosine/adenosine deaminase-related metal-dependent hydrolase